MAGDALGHQRIGMRRLEHPAPLVVHRLDQAGRGRQRDDRGGAATVSSIAIVLGVVLEPMIRSTLFSEISVRIADGAGRVRGVVQHHVLDLRPADLCGQQAHGVAFGNAQRGPARWRTRWRRSSQQAAVSASVRAAFIVGSYAISFGVGALFSGCAGPAAGRVQAGMPPCVENAPLQNTSAPASSSYRCRRRTWPIRMA